MASVFEKVSKEIFNIEYHAEIVVGELHGGVPSDQKKVEAWIKSKLDSSDDVIRDMVYQTMMERNVNPVNATKEQYDEAVGDVSDKLNLNGFKRLPSGELFIEGRQIKAGIKESINIAVSTGKIPMKGWGKTNKSIKNFAAEHVFVQEDKVPLGVTEPTGIHQRFVHVWNGNGIAYEEYVADAKLNFTVVTDIDWLKKEAKFWPTIWSYFEKEGLGAARSLGFGTFETRAWDENRL